MTRGLKLCASPQVCDVSLHTHCPRLTPCFLWSAVGLPNAVGTVAPYLDQVGGVFPRNPAELHAMTHIQLSNLAQFLGWPLSAALPIADRRVLFEDRIRKGVL